MPSTENVNLVQKVWLHGKYKFCHSQLYIACRCSYDKIYKIIYIRWIIELHERVTKLEEFCVDNSKFHAKNANRISRLERKSAKTKHVSTVPCHNRYAALMELCDDDDADHSNGEQERPRTPPVQPTTERQKTRLTIVGSSMVRGLGQMVSSDDIDSCCFTNPGANTDHTKGKIGQLTSPTDDVILLQIGSNNIPDDPVLTLLDKLDDVIDGVRQMRPLSQVVVAPIPLRIDSLSYLNNEIKRVNEFIRDKCSKDGNFISCIRDSPIMRIVETVFIWIGMAKHCMHRMWDVWYDKLYLTIDRNFKASWPCRKNNKSPRQRKFWKYCSGTSIVSVTNLVI